MKHVEDQDLLLLSHRALGFLRSLRISAHLWRCKECRSKRAALSSLSSAVALAVRPGMSGWRPYGIALWLKTVLVVTVMLGLGVASGYVVSYYQDACRSAPMKADEACQPLTPAPRRGAVTTE